MAKSKILSKNLDGIFFSDWSNFIFSLNIRCNNNNNKDCIKSYVNKSNNYIDLGIAIQVKAEYFEVFILLLPYYPRLSTLGVKVRNMKMEFNTGGTCSSQVGQ